MEKKRYEIQEWIKQRVKLLKNTSKLCNQWPGLKLFVSFLSCNPAAAVTGFDLGEIFFWVHFTLMDYDAILNVNW